MAITLRYGLQIVSGLHLDKPAAFAALEIPPKAPHLALLGNIGNVKDASLFEFLRRLLSSFRTVLYVPGNHEPYDSTWDRAKSHFKEFEHAIEHERLSEGKGKFVFMDQASYDLSPTITILGCTLFSSIPPEELDDISFKLNDFCYINDWTVVDHVDAHESDVAWLNEQVKAISTTHPKRKLIVLTHHSPIVPKTLPPSMSDMSAGFMTDLSSQPCWTNPNVKFWAFGHALDKNCDFKDEATGKRVMTNQQRRQDSEPASDFALEMVIGLGTV